MFWKGVENHQQDGDCDYAQELVDKLSGTGTPVIDENGNWRNMEHVEKDTQIGVLVDKVTGNKTRTNKAMIRYSKIRTHMHQRKG